MSMGMCGVCKMGLGAYRLSGEIAHVVCAVLLSGGQDIVKTLPNATHLWLQMPGEGLEQVKRTPCQSLRRG